MADPTFPDEWLAHSLEGVLSAERLAELRAKATPGRTLWETLVDEKIASDQQILSALSTRFRLKLADVATIDPKVREGVPEQLARRYRVLPLRITDSFLEIATANPFDLKEGVGRSEEHTSELQSQSNLVCRLLLEKKKKKKRTT